MIEFDFVRHRSRLTRKCQLLIGKTSKDYIPQGEYKNQLFDLLAEDITILVNALYEEILHTESCNNIHDIKEIILKELFSFYCDRLNDGKLGNVYSYEVTERDKKNLENALNDQLNKEIKRITVRHKGYLQKKTDSNNSKWSRAYAGAALLVTILFFCYDKWVETRNYSKSQTKNNLQLTFISQITQKY